MYSIFLAVAKMCHMSSRDFFYFLLCLIIFFSVSCSLSYFVLVTMIYFKILFVIEFWMMYWKIGLCQSYQRYDRLICYHQSDENSQAAGEMYFILYLERHQPKFKIFLYWYFNRLQHNLINFEFFNSKGPKQ